MRFPQNAALHIRPSVWLLRGLLIVLLLGIPLQAQDPQPEKNDPAEKIRIRKLYVPESGLAELLSERKGFLPIKIKDYEEKLAAVEAGSAVELPARISRAHVVAEINQQQQLSGQMYLFVNKRSSGKESLVFPGINFSVKTAQWLQSRPATENDDKETGDQVAEDATRTDGIQFVPVTDDVAALQQLPIERTAVSGTSPKGEYTLVVEKSGILRLEWQYPTPLSLAEISPQDSRFVQLKLPPAVSALFDCQLPVDQQLSTRDARCEKLPPVEGVNGSHHLWRVICETNRPLELEFSAIAENGLEAATDLYAKRAAATNESIVYSIGAGGITFAQTFELRSQKFLTDRILFWLPLDAICTSVTVNGTASEHAVAMLEGEKIISIDVPGELPVKSLTLNGFAPLISLYATALPRAKSTALAWSHGRVEMHVDPVLELLELELAGIELDVAANPANNGGAKQPDYRFVPFEADYSIRTRFVQQQPALKIQSLSVCSVSPALFESDQHVLLSSDQGDTFSITANFPPYWIVDSVSAEELDDDETSNTEKLIGFWEITDDPNSIKKNIFVQFTRPVTPSRQIALRVKAHRGAVSQQAISLDDFNAVSFPMITELAEQTPMRRPLLQMSVAIRSRGTVQLQLERAWKLFRPVSLDILDPVLRERAALDEQDYIFRLDADYQRPTVTMTDSIDEQFAVELDNSVYVTESRVKETLAIRCSLLSGSLGRMRLQIAGYDAPVEWNLGPFSEGRVFARQISRSPIEGAASAFSLQTYELEFRPAMTGAFDLIGNLNLPRQSEHLVSTVLVQDAVRQSTTATIGSNGIDVDLQATGVKSIPPLAADLSRFESLLHKFRLDADGPSQLTIRTAKLTSPAAWIEIAELEQRFSDQQSETIARYQLRYTATDSFGFRLPENATLQMVQQGQTSVEAIEQPGGFSVKLPADQEMLPITIIYTEPADRLNFFRSLPFAEPVVDVPVLETRRTLFIPNGWDLAHNWQPLNYQPTLENQVWDRLFSGLTAFVFEKTAPRSEHLGFPFARSTEEKMLRIGDDQQSSRVSGIKQVTRNRWFDDAGDIVEFSSVSNGLMLVRVSALETLRWFLFITAFCLILWVRFDRLRNYAVVLGSVFALVMLLPMLFSPLAAAVFWGMNCSMLAKFLFEAIGLPSALRASGPHDQTSMNGDRTTVTAAMLLIVLFNVPAQLTAQDKSTSDTASYMEVIFTIDEDEALASDVVYIPRSLYGLLNANRAVTEQEGYNQPLIHSAEYRAELVRDASGAGLDLQSIAANYSVETFRDDEILVLPFDTGNVLLTRDSIRLDAMQAELRMSDDDKGLRVVFPDAGLHRLTLEFLPRVPKALESKRIDIDIPKVHNTRLIVQLPRSSQELAVKTDHVDLQWDRFNSRYGAELGPTSQLNLQWPGRDDSTASNRLSVEELLTVEFSRDSSAFDYLWLITTNNRTSTDAFEIQIDGELRIDEDRSSNILSQQLLPDGRKQIVFEIDNDQAGSSVRARFFQDESPLGRVLLPVSQLKSAQITSRLAAILKPGQVKVVPINELTSDENESADVFVQLWNRIGEIGESQILQVIRLDQNTASLGMAISPTEQSFGVQSNLVLSIDKTKSNLTGTVRIEPSRNEGVSSIDFSLPPGYLIESVATTEKAEVLLELISGNRCQMMVKSNQTAFTIQLSASFATKKDVEFPELKLVDAAKLEQIVSLWRGFGLSLKLEQEQNWQAIEPVTINQNPQAEWFRFHSAWLSSPEWQDGPDALIRVDNLTSIDRGSLVSSVERVGSRLELELACFLKGNPDATLELVQIDIDPWIDRLVMADQPGKLSLVDIPFSQQKRIQFLPDQPLHPGTVLRIHASLIPGSPILPVVDWCNFSQNHRGIVRISKELGSHEDQWRMNGLAVIDSPPMQEIVDNLDNNDNFLIRQTASRSYSAELRPIKQQQMLSIPLQSVSIEWSGNEHFFASSQFGLSPCEEVLLEIQSPASIQVVEAWLDAAKLMIEVDAAGSQQLRLPASDYPRTLILLSNGRAFLDPQDRSEAVFEFPELVDYPAARRLVQIHMSNSQDTEHWRSQLGPVNAASIDIARLDMLHTFALALQARSDLLRVDRAGWLLQTRNETMRLQKSLDNANLSTEQADTIAAQFAEFNSEYQAELSQVPEEISNDSPPVKNLTAPLHDPVNPLFAEGQESRHVTSKIVELDNNADSARMRYIRPASESTRLNWRMTIAAMALLICIVIRQQAFWNRISLVLQPASMIILAMLGLAWSRYFSPSFIGWAFVIAALAICLRRIYLKRLLAYSRKR